VREARVRAGVPPAAEPAAAGRVARDRAERAAALGARRRLTVRGALVPALQREGLRRVTEVHEYLQEQRGYADPGASAVAQFRDHPLWRRAIDPEVTAFGAASARAADGSLLLVVLLVEEEPHRDLRAMELETEKGINRIRTRHGLRPLVPHEPLSEVARAHSRHMVQGGFFDHTDPSGRKPADRVSAAGVRWLRVTENIAMNAGMEDPVEQALAGWMDSPGHRANILDPEVTHTGLGVAEGEDGRYLFTQVFAALRATER
jgi:hypothetical protein